jgi:hypothetical protein
MSLTIEELSSHYNYLDDILTIFGDIYNKCPCQPCIDLSTEKILSFKANIQVFYYFLFDNKNFIKQNETYLKKIKELLPNMITFNNVIIKDIVLINTQIGVSVIYLEDEELCSTHFDIETLCKYYPELRAEFMS